MIKIRTYTYIIDSTIYLRYSSYLLLVTILFTLHCAHAYYIRYVLRCHFGGLKCALRTEAGISCHAVHTYRTRYLLCTLLFTNTNILNLHSGSCLKKEKEIAKIFPFLISAHAYHWISKFFYYYIQNKMQK